MMLTKGCIESFLVVSWSGLMVEQQCVGTRGGGAAQAKAHNPAYFQGM